MKRKIQLLLVLVFAFAQFSFVVDCFGEFSVNWHNAQDRYQMWMNDEWCLNTSGCVQDAWLEHKRMESYAFNQYDDCIEQYGGG